MTIGNKIFYLVLSIITLLFLLLLAAIPDMDGHSFLNYIRYEYFVFLFLIGFLFWIGFDKHLEDESNTYASILLMLVLPAFSIQTISNISFEQLNHIELDPSSFFIPGLLFCGSIYFPIRNLFIQSISTTKRYVPLILLLANIAFFIFLLLLNSSYITKINAYRSITKEIELNSIIHQVDLEKTNPQSFSYCAVTTFKTNKDEVFYGVYNSQLQSAEYYADLETGDSVVKAANSYDGKIIKKNDEKVDVTFVP